MTVTLPNILVTGTPGTGKSRICAEIAKQRSMKWQDVSKIAKDNGFVEEYDDSLECPVLDEDKLMDHLEPEIQAGGNVVEYHSCDFFPERWFDAVFVVQCNNTILYDRLQERGYNEKKIKGNIECEIFQMVLNEAKESYDEDIILQLSGETETDFTESIKKITDFIDNFRK
ncbi:adenylate kinase isoenzyme 6 homolog [Contarinia nasturtii]|uniref:adenylate kinase isoenzyme 6 homolog n=1 Tax=Contarinia nasturtii TaxID=265458 RepID=UPI0012D45EEE|nr:adenylate kinase isoenzyme 6 homolog [Contarinia nasturtii]